MKFLTDPVIKVIKGMLIVCMAIFLFLQIKQPSNSKAEFQDVVLAAIQDKDMSGYTQVDNLAIKRFLALNPDDFENITYYKNNDTMQASEIVIVKFKDNKQAANFKEAMLTRIKNQHTIFDGYIEKEETLLNSAIIDLQANYALYVVGEDATAIDKRFVQAL